MLQQGKGTALGFYFGQLLEFWIRHCPALTPTAVRVNTPIKAAEGASTVGQLKFLVQHAELKSGGGDDKSEQQLFLYHWEASVKFFLHAAPPPSTAECHLPPPSPTPLRDTTDDEGEQSLIAASGRALRRAAGAKSPTRLRQLLAGDGGVRWSSGATIGKSSVVFHSR